MHRNYITKIYISVIINTYVHICAANEENSLSVIKTGITIFILHIWTEGLVYYIYLPCMQQIPEHSMQD